MIAAMTEGCELTILMPCLNEAETLAACIDKAQRFLARSGDRRRGRHRRQRQHRRLAGDRRALGARVVARAAAGLRQRADRRASRRRAARYVIMGDADDSYDFSELEPFVEKLRAGYDLVMGNRFRGGIAPGAMPPLHRYLGNPVLTAIGRLFFRSPCGDFHCGLRGFAATRSCALDLRTTGMEFASEMVVKARSHGLRIAEVPTTLSPDGRGRPPHLRSWRDGWRHLRFLLLFSPRWLFLYPGVALIRRRALVAMLWLLPRPRHARRRHPRRPHAPLRRARGPHRLPVDVFWFFSKVYAIGGIVPRTAHGGVLADVDRHAGGRANRRRSLNAGQASVSRSTRSATGAPRGSAPCVPPETMRPGHSRRATADPAGLPDDLRRLFHQHPGDPQQQDRDCPQGGRDLAAAGHGRGRYDPGCAILERGSNRAAR